MHELIKNITEKAGINEDQARKAAQTVIDFLKQRLPANLSGQLDSLLGSGESKAGEMRKQAGRMFGQEG